MMYYLYFRFSCSHQYVKIEIVYNKLKYKINWLEESRLLFNVYPNEWKVYASSETGTKDGM